MNDPLGELSTFKLQSAIDVIDEALRDAPQEVRDALSIVRLVVNVPRRGHWYGIAVDPDDSSVTVGILLRNAADAYEREGNQGTARRLRRLLEMGRREYDDYLDHIFDPGRWERDRAAKRLTPEGADWIARRLTLESRLRRNLQSTKENP